MRMVPPVLLMAALLAPALAPAQVNKVPDMRTAMESQSSLEAQKHLKEGQRLQSEDAFEEAAAEFQAAIALDPLLMMAHYGLGTAKMAKKEYAAAIAAFEGAREAFLKGAERNAALRQRSEANRSARISTLKDLLRRTPETASSGAGGNASNNVQRQEWEAELAALEATGDASRGTQPPPGLLLSLGSAYFRSGRLADAEREYRAAIAAQPKLAEAHNNLAVVLLMTGRPADAREEIKLAKKSGFKVPPGLEADVDKALAKEKDKK